MFGKTTEVKHTRDGFYRPILVTTYRFFFIPLFVSKVVGQ